MLRPVLYTLFVLAGYFTACQNTSTAAAPPGNDQTRRDTALIEPDAADLLQTLQGKWQSEQDSSYEIEIVGEKMKHYNGGKISEETMIEIDGNCLTNACKVDSIDIDNGWCFVEKGQYDAQCNLILKCDKQVLQYRALGAASPALIFKKK